MEQVLTEIQPLTRGGSAVVADFPSSDQANSRRKRCQEHFCLSGQNSPLSGIGTRIAEAGDDLVALLEERIGGARRQSEGRSSRDPWRPYATSFC